MTEQRMENTLEDYFSSLLTEPSLDHRQRQRPAEVAPAGTMPKRARPLSQLLEQARDDVTTEERDLPQVLPVFRSPSPVQAPEVDVQVVDEVTVQAVEEAPPAPVWENIETDETFQALFFEVAGVTFGVLLTELGGIHQLTEVSPLFGKPDWFAGIMLQREEKLNVVDTVKWVMPNQAIDADYKYLVMLGDTNWGLSCECLIGTEQLNRDDVKWREKPGARPWLAGMIKQKMCALVHVKEFIAMLDKGINIDGD